jgi:type IV pilus assembly protein PilW
MTTHRQRQTPPHNADALGLQSGFTLIELMVAITISLLIMLALITVFVNITRSNAEMAKTNAQIENGRFAMQLLQDDIVHAGFWASYVPQFDDLSSRETPSLTSATAGSVPTFVPNPCLAYDATNWTPEYMANLLGIPVQGYDTVPAGCTTLLANQKADTDMIVVRHADTCVATTPASPNCEANIAGNLYFQASLCTAAAQGAGVSTITLSAASSAVDDVYNGKIIRIVAGVGAGQYRTITDYVGATKVATVDSNWVVQPNDTSNYSLDGVSYIFDTAGHTSTNRNCTTVADLRKFVSNIYYIRDFAVTSGDDIPTLMRSQFGLSGSPATLQQMPAVELIEGIEGFRVEYGIDNISETGAVVDYTAPVNWEDPSELVTPTNRGDGIPDQYVRCPTADTAADTTSPSTQPAATACTIAQLTNVVTAKLYVLARSPERTPGYVDTKTYRLGTTTLGPFNDNFKRHVFSTTVRLTNVSGRRETP